jgi:hypothetical protein
VKAAPVNHSVTAAGEPPPSPRTAWAGLVRRQEAWRLTWRGWLALLLLMAAVVTGAVVTVYPFLAVTARRQPDVLVIEGWMPEFALLEGWHEYQRGHYTAVLTIGGPFRDSVDLDPNDDYGDLAAYKLRQTLGAGIPVQAIRCPAGKRDRTFTCAVTLKAWLAQHQLKTTSVTVVTLGPHARRSRLLYEMAFGPDVPVGVISVPDEEYEGRRWWKYSEGVKEIISEGAAYVYARLFFHPGNG